MSTNEGGYQIDNIITPRMTLEHRPRYFVTGYILRSNEVQRETLLGFIVSYNIGLVS